MFSCLKTKNQQTLQEYPEWLPQYEGKLITEREEYGMCKKLAELTVNKSLDYYDTVVAALENAGYLLVLDAEASTDKYYHYIVAGIEEEINATKDTDKNHR